MIKLTSLSALRHREALELYSDMQEVFCQIQGLPSVLQPLYDTFTVCLSAYETALHPSASAHLTAELAQLDRLRVCEVRSLFCYLKFLSSAPESGKAEAAVVLLGFMDKKACTRKPYRDKTAAIDRLLQMVGLEPNRRYLYLLDVECRLSRLRALNEQFQSIYATRAALLSGIRPGAARAARTATGEAFVKLCEMLNALALVNGEAAYKPSMDRIDELLAEARETVDRRLRHRKPGATNGQSVSPPDTPDIPT